MRTVLREGDAIISYLPYPHAFEQALLTMSMLLGLKVGYYCGNPMKLFEDCSILKPALFPSVPRVYNKIYAILQAKFSTITGCKRWLFDRGMSAKL